MKGYDTLNQFLSKKSNYYEIENKRKFGAGNLCPNF